MHFDLSMVSQTLPIIKELSQKRTPSDDQWISVTDAASLTSILENGNVTEDNGRVLTLEEWIALWHTAATEGQPQLGLRQQYMLENMRTAITHINDLEHLLENLVRDETRLSERIQTVVMANLPQLAILPDTITLVLGTASGGFATLDRGIFVDLAAIQILAPSSEDVIQFLEHETWHAGHGSLVQLHPKIAEPWFIPLLQVQSEGMVNHLIGGTYRYLTLIAQRNRGEEAEKAKEYLEYADTMYDKLEPRMIEYIKHFEALIDGDMQTYQEYTCALPNHPGYLHGVSMARAIGEVMGKKALIATAPDPALFLLTAIRAFRILGIEICTPAQHERFDRFPSA